MGGVEDGKGSDRKRQLELQEIEIMDRRSESRKRRGFERMNALMGAATARTKVAKSVTWDQAFRDAEARFIDDDDTEDV